MPTRGRMDGDSILDAQGGILVEMDQAQTFRVGEDGLLHFRIRNLTGDAGRLTMSLRVSRVDLDRTETDITLRPGGVQDVRFPLSSDRAGEKLVEELEVRFTLGGQDHRLVLPDHSVTFRMARVNQSPGAIDLSGATINLPDHVGDVSIQARIDSQAQTHPTRSDEHWVALALITRPVDGHVVLETPRRQGLRDLLLAGRRPGQRHETRVFLFARAELPFGRSVRKGTTSIPLVLWRLPCRSKTEDRDNHWRTDAISGLHGRIALQDERLCIRDESTNGTLVDDHRMPNGEWDALPPEFRLDLTADEPVLSLEGRISYPGARRRALALGWPRGCSMGEGLDVGAEHALSMDALCLRRLGNAEHHRYVQVFRAVTVGSGRQAALHFPDEGVVPMHAQIIFYRGEWFVRTLDPAAKTEVDGRCVGREEYVSIAPGKTVTFGTLNLSVRVGSARAMTEF